MLITFIGEGPPVEDGYIEPSIPHEQVRQEPYALQSQFEWTTVDIQDPNQVFTHLCCGCRRDSIAVDQRIIRLIERKLCGR